MALTNTGTKVTVKKPTQPDGWAPNPADVYFNDWTLQTKPFNLTVDKATVEAADESTTFTNILTNATIGVHKQLEDLLATIVDTAKNLSYWVHITDIDINLNPTEEDSDLYLDQSAEYEIIAKAYLKAGVLP